MKHPIIFEKYLIYVMKNLINYTEKQPTKSGITEPIASILTSAYEENFINELLPKEMILDLFVFSFVELTKCYYLDPKNFDLEQMSWVCTDLFVNAVEKR